MRDTADTMFLLTLSGDASAYIVTLHLEPTISHLNVKYPSAMEHSSSTGDVVIHITPCMWSSLTMPLWLM